MKSIEYRIPTRQSCKTVIVSFSFLTDDFSCLNKVFTLHYTDYITLHYITLDPLETQRIRWNLRKSSRAMSQNKHTARLMTRSLSPKSRLAR